jgi:glutathione S-transferase
MPFTLYNAPQSTCSQRVRFELNAKGLPFEEKKLDLLPAISSSLTICGSIPTAWCRP